MNRLMFSLGRHYCMAAAGDEGGSGGGGGGGGASGGDNGGQGGDNGGQGGDNGGTGGDNGGQGGDNGGEENIESAIAQKSGKNDGANGGENTPPAIDAETSKIADEEYTKALVADAETKKLAADEKIELSPELVKGMMPALKAAGVKPEQAGALANALAREQIKAEKARISQRIENCKKMNAEAMKLYPSEEDWKVIGAGVERFFKPGGAMHYTITHSELGSDPEFLALMKYVGERVRADKAAGAASGTGGGQTRVNMAKALGITK